MATIIIVGVILVYSAFVIFKKVKDIRNGKYCNCGCDGCSSSKNCGTNRKNEL